MAMVERFSGFDWDAGNRAKCQKHGVPLSTIEALFTGPLAVLPDPTHSGAEERFKAIGKTGSGRYVFLVFTIRERQGDRLIRPISARHMHRAEVEAYEKAHSDL